MKFPAQHAAAAIIAMVFVIPLWMILDRAPPYRIEAGQILPATPLKNSEITIQWDVTPLRSCAPQEGSTVTRTIVDSKGVRHVYAPVPATYGTNDQFKADEIQRAVPLPENITGPASYSSLACYPCNPVQKWLRMPILHPDADARNSRSSTLRIQATQAGLGTTEGRCFMIRYLHGLIMLGLVTVLMISAGYTRDDGQWDHSDVKVREWFQSLMQPDNSSIYEAVAVEADAFEADTFEVDGDHYVAIITDGKGVLPTGTKIQVPNQKMKWDRGNPTGHGIIFIGNQGQIYCYVAPGGV